MTVVVPVVPLEATPAFPLSPAFASAPNLHATAVIKAIMKARRIVVVCGAGISVHAGIPDFRSPQGLFQMPKRENARGCISSGRDLFDASVFNSQSSTSLFYQMIARLSMLSQAAEPTPFHRVLRALDEYGNLLRVYTQNIDAIETRCGLSFGVPDSDSQRYKSPGEGGALAPIRKHRMSGRSLSPYTKIPRCIPLHGTLQSLHCCNCNYTCPLDHYLSFLSSGIAPQCPECIAMDELRQLVRRRPRGIGKLRPDVVLYNEAHRDGERIGEAIWKDLTGTSQGNGVDLLLVVGTSLHVPGTRRIVREFAKALHSRSSYPMIKDPGSRQSSPSPHQSSTTNIDFSIKSVYLNLDFPAPMREWEGVFDVWLQGDAQYFAEKLQASIHDEARVRDVTSGKRKRTEEGSCVEDAVAANTKKAKMRAAVANGIK